MALTDIRRTRTRYVFLAVVLGQILLISAQVNTGSGSHVLEAVVLSMFTGVQDAIGAAASAVGNTWSGYVWLHRVEAENRQLKTQLEDAEVALQEQRAIANRSRDLQALLDLRNRSALETMAADVIGAGATADFRTLTIDRGADDGVREDMAVIAPGGVVGRIVVPGGRAAKVQLLIDRNAAAGALIERSRVQGIAVGGGEDTLRLDYVPAEADLAVGDTVLTSGIDGIFPKGFVIGRIASVDRTGGAYRRIVVEPAVDFRRLEDVLVVLTPSPDRRTADGTVE